MISVCSAECQLAERAQGAVPEPWLLLLWQWTFTLVHWLAALQVLGDDYSKLAFLCADRTLQFHARFGAYYKTRIPKFGRALTYDRWSCDLLVAASSPEVYRLNLEQGRFLAPLTTRSPGVNVVGRSPVHGLIACGGEDGALECFDLRTRHAVGRIDAAGPAGPGQQVTALRFEEQDGLALAVGTSGGQVRAWAEQGAPSAGRRGVWPS